MKMMIKVNKRTGIIVVIVGWTLILFGIVFFLLMPIIFMQK